MILHRKHEQNNKVDEAFNNINLAPSTPQQERELIKNIGIKLLQVGELWYPIDKHWYDSWEKYTMFNKGDNEIADGIENLHQINGPRPGAIDNSALIGISTFMLF